MDTLGQTEHVQSSHRACLDSLDGVILVMRGRSRASKMVDLVYFEVNGLRHVVNNKAAKMMRTLIAKR